MIISVDDFTKAELQFEVDKLLDTIIFYKSQNKCLFDDIKSYRIENKYLVNELKDAKLIK